MHLNNVYIYIFLSLGGQMVYFVDDCKPILDDSYRGTGGVEIYQCGNLLVWQTGRMCSSITINVKNIFVQRK
jgi:hypothetical protein